MNQQPIVDALQASFAITFPEAETKGFAWQDHFSKPPKREMGDVAFACFELAKAIGQSPVKVATSLAANLPVVASVTKAETKGPYINFFLSRGDIIKDVCQRV